MSEYIHMNISINEKNTPHSNRMKWCRGNWFELYKVTKLYEYSATNFENEKRSNKLAIGASSIILDFDEGITLDEARNTFSDFISLIVTTKSHQKEKHGLVCDRFRVILPLPYSIIDIEYYMQLMQEIVRFYKSDIACTDAARYYSPNPNQKAYYSKASKFFDVSIFEKSMKKEKDIEQNSSISYNSKNHFTYSTNNQNKLDLTRFLNHQITYKQNDRKTVDTLKQLIITSNQKQIKCHCFLNPTHEDKNPSCVLYLNNSNVYAKCFACNLDAMLIKKGKK